MQETYSDCPSFCYHREMVRSEYSRDAAELAVRLQVAMSRLASLIRGQGESSSGFTTTQLRILQRLIEDGPATVAAIAAAEKVTAQSVSQSVATLKTVGVLVAQPDGTDGRKKTISVTTVGRGLFATVLSARVAWLAAAIEATVAPAERHRVTDVIDLLERLTTAESGCEITSDSTSDRPPRWT